MAKVVLNQPVRYPFGFDNVHKMGAVLDVSEEDESKLREMGAVEDETPEPVETQADTPDPVDEPPEEAPEPAPKYGPLPKKTAGVNVWKEYARDNGIDIRGLSEKAEIMGHLMKVASQ